MERISDEREKRREEEAAYTAPLVQSKPNSIETHFSWMRTRMSTERTLMSWVRTGSSLIGFGFTIAQFLAKVNQSSNVSPALILHSPRIFGLALIGVGTVALFFACVDYIYLVRYLRSKEFDEIRGPSMITFNPLLPVAMVLTVIGLLTFVALLIRT